MRKKRFQAFLLVGFLAAGRPASASVCLDADTSTEDQAVWDIHGCDTSFASFERQAFDVRFADDSLACTLPYEYPKHWSAAWLLINGLSNNYDQQWHSSQDYCAAAASNSPDYHDYFYQQVRVASWFGRWAKHSGDDEVDTSCKLYDPFDAAGRRSSHANPGSRGGDFVHEAFHGWLDHYGYSPGHLENPPGGACRMTGKNCDNFYFHGVGAFDFGYLWYTDGTGDHFHTPNQTQVEYLCDVAILPQSWVPAAVSQAAQKDTEQRVKTRFINGPAAKCGDPRPW
jgi:hypothetical protein